MVAQPGCKGSPAGLKICKKQLQILLSNEIEMKLSKQIEKKVRKVSGGFQSILSIESAGIDQTAL